jgi:carbon storage regulator
MQMLILTRLPGQTLLIDDDVVIEVLGVEGQQVRLGLTAPSDITILRQELAERLARAEISTLQRRKQLP